MILWSLVLSQYQRVRDGQTDTPPTSKLLPSATKALGSTQFPHFTSALLRQTRLPYRNTTREVRLIQWRLRASLRYETQGGGVVHIFLSSFSLRLNRLRKTPRYTMHGELMARYSRSRSVKVIKIGTDRKDRCTPC